MIVRVIVILQEIVTAKVPDSFGFPPWVTCAKMRFYRKQEAIPCIRV